MEPHTIPLPGEKRLRRQAAEAAHALFDEAEAAELRSTTASDETIDDDVFDSEGLADPLFSVPPSAREQDPPPGQAGKLGRPPVDPEIAASSTEKIVAARRDREDVLDYADRHNIRVTLDYADRHDTRATDGDQVLERYIKLGMHVAIIRILTVLAIVVISLSSYLFLHWTGILPTGIVPVLASAAAGLGLYVLTLAITINRRVRRRGND